MRPSKRKRRARNSTNGVLPVPPIVRFPTETEGRGSALRREAARRVELAPAARAPSRRAPRGAPGSRTLPMRPTPRERRARARASASAVALRRSPVLRHEPGRLRAAAGRLGGGGERGSRAGGRAPRSRERALEDPERLAARGDLARSSPCGDPRSPGPRPPTPRSGFWPPVAMRLPPMNASAAPRYDRGELADRVEEVDVAGDCRVAIVGLAIGSGGATRGRATAHSRATASKRSGRRGARTRRGRGRRARARHRARAPPRPRRSIRRRARRGRRRRDGAARRRGTAAASGRSYLRLPRSRTRSGAAPSASMRSRVLRATASRRARSRESEPARNPRTRR